MMLQVTYSPDCAQADYHWSGKLPKTLYSSTIGIDMLPKRWENVVGRDIFINLFWFKNVIFAKPQKK